MYVKIQKIVLRLKCWISGVPLAYLFIPLIVLFCSLIIRLATGTTHVIYNVLGNRSLFPGPILYSVSYFFRLILCSILSVYMMSLCRAFKESVTVWMLAVLPVLLMLFEYRLIFGGISLILAILFCVFEIFFSILATIRSRYKNRAVFFVLLIYVILQTVFLIQTISLAVCI